MKETTPLLPCPAEPFLPHASPMALIDEIVDFADGYVRTRLRIGRDSPFARNGGVPGWIGMEYMAQTIAAFAGYAAAGRNEAVKIGFLVSSRHLQFSKAQFAFGDVLDIEAREVNMEPGGLATFDCRILCGQDIAATARINVFQPADPAAVLHEV